MDLLITPEYKNLFPEGGDTLEKLLHDVPSIAVIQLIALMDAELHVSHEDPISQSRLFNLLLNRQAPHVKMSIMERISREDRRQVRLFTRHYNMTFLHYELCHFRDLPIPEGDDLSPDQEFKIFKAYFLVAEQWAAQESKEESLKPELDESYFAKMMWPGLAAQFDLNYHIVPYHFMTRGAVLLNNLQYHSPYQSYVSDYLAKHNKTTALNYVMDICQILAVSYSKVNVSKWEFYPFTLNRAPGFESLFEQFTLEINKYANVYKENPKNYAGIKSKPLLKLNEDKWLVLNWNFLANKLYEGLVFDFFQESGIAAEPEFQKFTNFKSYVASEVTEKKLFRQLLRAAFNKPYGRLLFDNGGRASFPDAYYRIGNKVFLIELKDVAFPSTASDSFSYKQIVAAIDQKINNKGKGTGQLLKQIALLKDQPFEPVGGYKYSRNLQIYPVIIYTDTVFNMPGVNYYVGKSFNKQVDELGLKKHFKSIKALTLINLNYLVGVFYLLRKREISLDIVIDYYHQQIVNREKKHDRMHQIENHIAIYDVFESVVAPLFDKYLGEDLVKELFDALNLNEGLQN